MKAIQNQTIVVKGQIKLILILRNLKKMEEMITKESILVTVLIYHIIIKMDLIGKMGMMKNKMN